MVRKKEIKEEKEEKIPVSEKLDEIANLLRENQQLMGEKKFKPKKIGNRKLKKGYVLVQTIGENNVIDFRKLPCVNGNIYLKDRGTYHLSDAEYIGTWKKMPIIVIPTWSNEPITKEVLTRTVDKNKSTIKPQKQIIHLMEDARAAEQMKPKAGAKGIIIILIIIAAIYIIGRGQGWF